MNDLILINEEQEIRKAEALVTSRYKLNPLALKLITTLISSVQSNDKINQVYSVSVSQFTDLANLKGNAYYKELERATDEILQKPIKINLGNNSWLKANWCSSIEYLNGEGVINFEISRKLFPYILRLKNNYLKYDLQNILPLRSDYSIRLYELLKDNYNKYGRYGKQAEVIYEIEFLRDRFQIPDSYGFEKVRERVLDKAKVDLLKHTDIKFDWEISGKIKKKVHSIKFKIYPNNKNIKISIKLPTYLDNYMSYVNYLREKYQDTQKYFIASKYTLNDKHDIYFFGINKNGLMFAMSSQGGNSINLSKNEAEVIYTMTYNSAMYSEVYREFISNTDNLLELSRDSEYMEYYQILMKQIATISKEYDPRQRPAF